MKKICLFLLLVTMLTSCVKDVILDAKEDPLLAVYCVLKVDPVQELKLSYTKSATMDEAPRVADATAVLMDLTEGREAGRFVRVSDSLWQLKYTAIPAHQYRLEIIVPGHDTVWAEQTMPDEFRYWGAIAGTDIEPLTHTENPCLNLDITRLTTNTSWVDGITFGKVSAEGIFYSFVFSCPVWAWAETYDSESEQYVPVRQLCTDYPYVDDINLNGGIRQGTGAPESFNSPNLFSGTYLEYYLKGFPMHQDFLRFPPREDWSQQLEDFTSWSFFAIDGDFKDDASTTVSFQSWVYFAALSDDYDRFLCEAYKQYYAEQSSDISSIYLRDNLYSNIHGGLGVFGAVTNIYNSDYGFGRGQLWSRPRVRIEVFGPQYDPDDETRYY